MSDLISRKDAINAIIKQNGTVDKSVAKRILIQLPSAQPDIIRCKDCKYWRQQTNYAGIRLSFGFCESDNMWLETDDDFYCGYAERRTDEGFD